MVNRLFQLLENNQKLGGGGPGWAPLKMMGVGYYGSDAAMSAWRARHQVTFPLIPDPHGLVGKALDIPGTPTYVVLDQKGQVVYLFAGEIENPARFLKEMRQRLGL